MKITINLQEGFKDDSVVIFDNDKKIYESKDVSTRTQIGLAKSFEYENADKDPLIKVDVTSRDIIDEKKIESDGEIYVGISINENEELVWKISEQPFMYM